MAPRVGSKTDITLYERVRHHSPVVAKVILLMGCVAACVYLSILAGQQRYLAGDDTWQYNHDYWDETYVGDYHHFETHSLRFTTYTDLGMVYIAGAVGSAVAGGAVFLPDLIKTFDKEALEGPSIVAPDRLAEDLSVKQQMARGGLRLLATALLLGAFAGCVIMSIQAQHTSYMTHIDGNKFGAGSYNEIVRTSAGDGYCAGAVVSGIAGIGATPFAFLFFMTDFERQCRGESLSSTSVPTLRGGDIEKVLPLVKVRNLGPLLRQGYFTAKEVAFIREICDPVNEMSEELRTLGSKKETWEDAPIEKYRGARRAYLAEEITKLKLRWEQEKTAVFSSGTVAKLGG